MDGYSPIVIRRFDGGLNNSQSPFDIGENEWYRASNMMLAGIRGEDVLVRPGFIKQNRNMISGSLGLCGLFRFYLSSGTSYWVACYDDGIYYYDATNSKYTLLTCDLTLNSNQRFRFKIYNDLLLMVNGSNHPMYWDGTNNVHRLGIPGPSTAISTYVGDAGSGSLDTSADYFYKYTYYNSETGHESNLSDANASAFTTSTGKITVTIPQNASVDTQVDKIRLYRTEGGGTATGTFKWTGVNFASTGLAAGNITCADTVGDSSLSTTGNWTDRYQPGYGGGTDFKFIEICRERFCLAGESTNPSRLYISNIGFPERYGSSSYYDIGADDGDKITGLKDFKGDLIITKERSIWIFYNVYDPNAVNLICISRDNGSISDNFLLSDGDRIYFMDVDGAKFWDRAQFVKYSGKVDSYFGELNSGAEDFLPLPVKRNMMGIVWNRKLLHFFSSKETNTSSQVVKFTTEYTSDTGGETSTATFSADFGETTPESGTDAIIILDQTQSSLNKYIEVHVFIPFDTSQFRQAVGFSIFFSYDDGVSWKWQRSEIVKFQSLANYPGDLGEPIRIPRDYKDVAAIRNHVYTFYDVGVTQIRLDLHASWANGTLDQGFGDESDAARLTTIDLLAVGYYYVDTSDTVTFDRCLPYNIDNGKWDSVWQGNDFKPNVVAIGDRSSDLYELYYGDAEKGQVYQFGVGDYDDGEKIYGWLQTKHFGARDGIKRFFDRMFLKLLTETGSFQIVVFVDNVEKLRRDIRAESSEEYMGSAIFRRSIFGGNRAIVDRIVTLAKEGEFLTFQFIRERAVRMPLLQIMCEAKGMEF